MRKRTCNLCGHWHMVDVSKSPAAIADSVVPAGWAIIGNPRNLSKTRRYVCDLCAIAITTQTVDLLRLASREQRNARETVALRTASRKMVRTVRKNIRDARREARR